MDTLLSIKVFCAVAELRSFAAAAERLGLSPAMASKHVMHLERRLSTRLLNRTSRSVNLTETGRLYFDQAQATLSDLESVEAAISRTAVKPRGTIRLSAPVWMANTRFVALLAAYRERYPEVRFDIDLSDRAVNLIHEGFDLALRATREVAEGLVARPLGDFAFDLVGAPAYLERAGRPQTGAQLDGHLLLAYSLFPLETTSPVLPGSARSKLVPIMRTGNETLLHLATLQGLGLSFMPRWLIENDLADGRLEVVLPGEAGFAMPLFAVYPSRSYLSAKLRTFLDFVADYPWFE